ncbi:hypothetical protein [Coleofasciculus sp. FACHB-T130]|uniref:hypothetical protein n=1 Tax=Coleofasciculus sp. FACHB-T130 TaxID=2692792 RepID=UPI001A7E3E47|nr:hypothetical protein [Coleofasciculus sp. FACHB-T130]
MWELQHKLHYSFDEFIQNKITVLEGSSVSEIEWGWEVQPLGWELEWHLKTAAATGSILAARFNKFAKIALQGR